MGSARLAGLALTGTFETGAILLMDRGAVAQPAQVDISRRDVPVEVIISRVGFDGAFVSPFVVFDMRIRKRNHSPTAMRRIWEIEKGLLVHIDTEVWPANAVGIHIDKGEQPLGFDRDFGVLFESHKRSKQPVIDGALAHINVQ